jgi:Tol biopolymer transport system component
MVRLLISREKRTVSYLNNQTHFASQLLGLALATAMLTSLFAVTSHSATRASFAVVDKTNAPTSSLTKPQPSSELKANGKIAFTSDRDGNREIYVMNGDGTDQTRLTNNSLPDDYPTWSPDGNRLAFLSQNTPGNYVIKVMNSDGTSPTQLTDVAVRPDCFQVYGPGCGLSWSPQGTKIAFTDTAGIFTINVNGTNRLNLTNGHDTHPSWSPDGSRIDSAFRAGDRSCQPEYSSRRGQEWTSRILCYGLQEYRRWAKLEQFHP